MAVPAHDHRDFKFARKYRLSIRVVVQPPDESTGQASSTLTTDTMTEAWPHGGVMINSGPLNDVPTGKDEGQSVMAAIQWLEEHGKGKGTVNYRLRDWLISRQRYWGTPIPVVHCSDCGIIPVPDADLPVELPENVAFSGRGPSPLAKLEEWINVPCPSCGTPARRETDTMDTFIDSSWYFLRYPDATNDQQVFDPAKTNDWMPVDQYVGGIEHAILHLLYSRFFTKVLRDSDRLIPGECPLLNFEEPFQRLLTQGMVQATTYKNLATGKYVPPARVDPANPRDPETGEPLEVSYEKMSKSKYNGVPPEAAIARYGADTARMFTLFKAPPEKDLEWDDADVEGQFRFLNRVWRLVTEFNQHLPVNGTEQSNQNPKSKLEKDLRRAVHTAIQRVTEDLEGDYQFNTAVSELMKLSNALNDATCKDSPVYGEGIRTLILLLSPFAPHITEELWQAMGHAKSVHTQQWPTTDPAALVADEVTLVIQILGKTRGTIQVPASASREALEQYARQSPVAQRYIQDKEIKKVIVVPGKLVNFVVG